MVWIIIAVVVLGISAYFGNEYRLDRKAHKLNSGSEEELTYWHTYNNDEVDAVIGDARIAIEIKSTDHIETEHKKGLKRFVEEHPDAKQFFVSRDFLTRRSGDIDLYYVTDFFKALWAGEII